MAIPVNRLNHLDIFIYLFFEVFAIKRFNHFHFIIEILFFYYYSFEILNTLKGLN